MDLEQIRRHWEKAGEEFPHGAAVSPTSRDPYLGTLERDNVLQRLRPEDACLEIGCGDGSHTVHYAPRVKRLEALDLAASLADMARGRLREAGAANATVRVGSVLDLLELFPGVGFDCVISQRCLINLPEWEHQKDALGQVRDRMREGGLLLLTEGFQEPLDELNRVRSALGLEVIRVAEYNRNFRRSEFEDFVSRDFEILERGHYGAYLFLSRVYHPLAVAPEGPKHDSPLNRVAMEIARAVPMPDLEKVSYNLFYVLRKKPSGPASPSAGTARPGGSA